MWYYHDCCEDVVGHQRAAQGEYPECVGGKKKLKIVKGYNDKV